MAEVDHQGIPGRGLVAAGRSPPFAATLGAVALAIGLLVVAPAVASRSGGTNAPGIALLAPRTGSNVSLAPCSLMNFSDIRRGFEVGQSWTPPELENISAWSAVVSGWFNATCVLPAFGSMVQAHVRSMSNFTWDTGNSGIYTSQVNLSVDFGAHWCSSTGIGVEEIWSGEVDGTVNEGVRGPLFPNGVVICQSGPADPPYGPVNGTSSLAGGPTGALEVGAVASMGAGSGAVAVVTWRKGIWGHRRLGSLAAGQEHVDAPPSAGPSPSEVAGEFPR